jgi:CRP-like cAMP-binding protein
MPSSVPSPSSTALSKSDKESCQNLLKDCEMFHRLSQGQVQTLVSRMKVLQLDRNQVLVKQGQPTTSFFLLENGDIRREFYDINTGKHHTVEFLIKAKSINSMRILSGDPAHSTVKCTSAQGCKLYEMPRQELIKVLHKRPDIGIEIASSLSDEVRVASKKYATPLFEQRQQEINVPAVMIAAGIESYYRSALNAQINRALTGVTSDWFPNMHIQVPVRIAYITGFKGIRSVMDRYMEQQDNTVVESAASAASSSSSSSAATSQTQQAGFRMAMAIAPGVLMTPISSVLEASNAGHLNNEPMSTRWMRGIVARCGREIVFGFGLNQLSDYWEERWQEILGRDTASPVVCNAAGSLTAGVLSGYFSHVPHNMSTYKLLEPHRSYASLYSMFVDRSVPPAIEQYLAANQMKGTTLAQMIRYATATLFPRGLLVRTTQIVGSFMILNGTINYLQLREHQKIQRAVSVPPSSSSSPNGSDNDQQGSDNVMDDEQTMTGGPTVAATMSLHRMLSRAD